MLDALESGSFKLVVKNKATMTSMGMLYPRCCDYKAFALCISSYIHTGVGFGVARSTTRAMPEPQCVG